MRKRNRARAVQAQRRYGSSLSFYLGIFYALALATSAYAQTLASIDPVEKLPLVLAPTPANPIELFSGLTSQRSGLILGTLPNVGDRTDRMRGVIEIWKNPKPFFDALPDFADGKPIPLAASIRAYDKVLGYEQPAQLDAWIKGTFSILPTTGTAGQFGALAIGVDQLVSGDFLLGSFAQVDGLLRGGLDPSLARGGWTLGGYGTWRITENLFLDTLAGHGNSVGLANPGGSGFNRVSTEGWLLTSALAGDWAVDNWKFTPKVRLRYYDEAAVAYTDADGHAASVARGGVGELGFSPAVTYLLTTDEDIAVETGVKFETATGLNDIEDIAKAFGVLRGNLEGTVNLKLPTGTHLKSSIGYDGVGTDKTNLAFKASLQANIP